MDIFFIMGQLHKSVYQENKKSYDFFIAFFILLGAEGIEPPTLCL